MVMLSLFFLLYRDPLKKQAVIFPKKTLDKFQDSMVKSARPNENDSHLGIGRGLRPEPVANLNLAPIVRASFI